MAESSKETDKDFNVRNPELIGITLKDVVSEIAAGISSSDFQQIVTILKNKSAIAKNLYEMQTADITNDNNTIIDTMCIDTGIDAKYDEITKLVDASTADKNSSAWRPTTGDCNMQLAAYKKICLNEKKKTLQNLVEEQRSKRLLLQKSLDRKRADIEALQKDMATAKKKLLRNSENYILNSV